MTPNLLLVTFSLRNPAKNYESFFVALRGNAVQWWHYIEQTSIVATTHDVNEFSRRLYPHMEDTDSLLVVTLPLSPDAYNGWLPKDAWAWVNRMSAEIEKSQTSLFPPPPKI